jgi:hypothetical protein
MIKIEPAPGRHMITIENCKPGQKYSLLLVAIPKDGNIPLISNELQVMLPLDLSEIERPDLRARKFEEDFYDEYIEIIDAEYGKLIFKSSFINIFYSSVSFFC